MTLYEGTILGFNYLIELEDDNEFQAWLKAKLEQYVLNDPKTKEVLKEILGIAELESRVQELEAKP